MEQAQYWMWMRRRHEFFKSHFQVSMNTTLSDSWEEKAFAEDAAGSSGCCIWPPRSYSCTFCGREFRSAQALGGHMNVHRRDKAWLKQSLSPTDEVVPRKAHNQNPQKPSNHHQSEFPDHSSDGLDRNSTVSASTVSGLSTQENFSTTTFSIFREELKGQLFGSDSAAKRSLNNNVITSDSKPDHEAEKSIQQVGEDSMCLGSDNDHHDHVETNSSVGLNSVFFQNRPTVTCGGDQEIINYKRPKIAVSTLPFIVSKENYSPLQWQVLGINPASGSMEDLDLELRLGVLQ